MSDVRLEREFSVPPQRLFDVVSTQSGLLQWWGPEGMHVPEHDLDFTRTGAWFSVMAGDEGQRFKVSGHVTHVNPPKSVGFTWGWHDDGDMRGHESHVTFTIIETPTGSRLVIDHRELDSSEQSANHERGWISSLNKLTAALS